ncbi:MAG: corrinoid protein [Clostridiales bacterium]|nr:corrinoid protein [Clostridiales bacterium]
MTLEEYSKNAYDAMLDMDEDLAYETLDNAIEEGIDLTALLTGGYSAGMQELGEQFSSGEVFLPDLMYASEIMQTVSAKIEEIMLGGETQTGQKGSVVFATVEGDVHDIGKGICCSLLKSNGITVYDMGRDVPAEDIVDKAEEVGADIIALSALLVTTMTCQKQLIDILNERGIRDKYIVMVGGAPVTSRWAQKIGADRYTEDAAECASVAVELLASK